VASLVSRAQAVAERELNGHDAAETVHEGNEVCEVVGADQAEVAWVLGIEEVDLLVLGWSLSVRRSSRSSLLCVLTRLLYNFFGCLLDAIGHSRSL
jgi:hypothetical protein